MNKATVTKTLKKLETLDGEESLGFKRYMALPENVKRDMGLCHVVVTNNPAGFVEYVKDLFGEMTTDEYREWCLSYELTPKGVFA